MSDELSPLERMLERIRQREIEKSQHEPLPIKHCPSCTCGQEPKQAKKKERSDFHGLRVVK